jgi:hypothetical protein
MSLILYIMFIMKIASSFCFYPNASWSQILLPLTQW